MRAFDPTGQAPVALQSNTGYGLHGVWARDYGFWVPDREAVRANARGARLVAKHYAKIALERAAYERLHPEPVRDYGTRPVNWHSEKAREEHAAVTRRIARKLEAKAAAAVVNS